MTAEALVAQERSGWSTALGDCAEMSRRSVRHLTRNVDEVIQAFVVPILLLLMFRYLFGGAIKVDGPTYVNYLVAGVIVLSVAFNTPSTAVAIANDLQFGFFQRLRSMPVFQPAVLVGHVVAASLRSIMAVVLAVGVGWLIGFRPVASLGDWLAALGLLLVFILAMGWLAVLIGGVAGSVEGAGGLSFILVMLPYASSALVPPASMPSVLRAVVENQPFTPLIDATRALLIGTPVGNSLWLALAWWVTILVIGMAVTIRYFGRRGNQ
ncbi:ABC transporter permease [Nonomuraea sp. NPDC048826]|uniref:ABC transporter permease n=1 Tax=Nonomuraea sp. NPDC048826 TaxID=3364347 RepID=UPI00372472A6